MRRDDFTLQLFPNERIVVNFAGGGGADQGIEDAFGRPVDVAINHDPQAMAMHRANFPNAVHHIEDVWAVDPRMLTPRELFNAQGFPSDYIVDHGIGPDGELITLSKAAQVRMCGNAVCPPLARALVEANFQHESQVTRRAYA